MRQTFKTHQIHCTSEMPYRILCAGPLDELRAYDKFLLANPEIAAQITHKTLKNSMIKDVKSLVEKQNPNFLDILGYQHGAWDRQEHQAWQMATSVLPGDYFKRIYDATMSMLDQNSVRLLPGAELPFQLRLEMPGPDTSFTNYFLYLMKSSEEMMLVA